MTGFATKRPINGRFCRFSTRVKTALLPLFSIRYDEWQGGDSTAICLFAMSAAPVTFCSELSPVGGCQRRSLLSRARRGDREAFTQMVTPYVPTMLQRARRLTGNSADAEDVSQEALLKAWSRLEQFSGNQDQSTDDFRAWLARIAGNTSIDLLRQRRDGKMLSLEEPRGSAEETLGSGIAARADNPEEQCARRQMGRILADAIVQLPADLRQACLLRDVMHYSSQEVADRLGISVVAVRLRLFRARRRLREKMAETLRPKTQRADRRSADQKHVRSMEKGRTGFLPLSAGYASGD
jgi:RNA polymerase sigma-70 factor, ECF subfamily